ncbi:hypothetical protein B0H14DRAFT_2817532 [Mycena olivaceomarginata]|nr:hypothetical protein B0H14DRAFT_2817532 [Mycena olivaceomarginata]
MAVEIPQYTDSWAPSYGDVSTSPSSRVNTPTSASSSSTLGSGALLAFPFGHYDRPSPALLSAVYMWGSRLSQAPRHHVYNEDAFLVCTLQNIHQDLGGKPSTSRDARHPGRDPPLPVLPHVRPPSGGHISLQRRSLPRHQRQPPPDKSAQITVQPAFGVLETPFSPPAHALEEGERINAFWTTLIVNNYWVAGARLPDYVSLVGSFSASYSPSNAPPMSEYGQPLFDAMGDSSGGTVAKFLAGLNLDGFSEARRAITLSDQIFRGVFTRPNDSDHADAAAFNSLDVLLEQFILSLPLGLELGGVESYKRSLMVTQTLAHAATIRLHAHRIHTSNVSRSRYLAAARAVVDPILGILWTTVCEVFIGELSSMQSFGVVGRLTQQHEDLTSCLETILSTMRTFAGAVRSSVWAYSALTNSGSPPRNITPPAY